MLLFWLCFAVFSAIVSWLLMEIKSLQQEVALLRDECYRCYVELDKHPNR